MTGIYINRMSGHRLTQSKIPVIPCPEILNPHTVPGVPLAVAPSPSAVKAPVIRALIPRNQGIAPVEEPVPLAQIDASHQPLQKTGHHPL